MSSHCGSPDVGTSKPRGLFSYFSTALWDYNVALVQMLALCPALLTDRPQLGAGQRLDQHPVLVKAGRIDVIGLRSYAQIMRPLPTDRDGLEHSDTDLHSSRVSRRIRIVYCFCQEVIL